MTERAKRWQSKPWNQNGKPALSQTAMDFDQDEGRTMLSEQSMMPSEEKTNGS